MFHCTCCFKQVNDLSELFSAFQKTVSKVVIGDLLLFQNDRIWYIKVKQVVLFSLIFRKLLSRMLMSVCSSLTVYT